MIALAVAALGAGAPEPASAAEAGTITVTATATLSNGVSYFGLRPLATVRYQLASDACADNSASTSKPGGTVVGGMTCYILAEGDYAGWCESGSGNAAGLFVNSETKSYEFEFAFTNIGGKVVLSGTIENPDTGSAGLLSGVLAWVPTSGSCANGTATGFSIVGDLNYVIV